MATVTDNKVAALGEDYTRQNDMSALSQEPLGRSEQIPD
jgi:hypothetical protein